MKHFRIHFLILAAMLLCALLPHFALTAHAKTCSGPCGDDLYWTLDTKTGVLEITGTGSFWEFHHDLSEYDGEEISYRCPASYPGWYEYRKYVRSVRLPSGIEELQGPLFFGCTNLTEIQIPDGVRRIMGDEEGGSPFELSGIASITLPDSLESIGGYAFAVCRNLTELTIPEGVKEIDTYAFFRCTALNSLTIPDSVTRIGENALSKTAYANDAANWDGKLLYLGKFLLSADSSIETAKIKAGTTFIAESVFANNNNLKTVTFPKSLKHVGADAFYGCGSLTSVSLPDSVVSIGSSAFAYCEKLAEIKLGSGVRQIEEKAFSGTAFETDAANWEDDQLYLGNCLIEVKRNVEALEVKAGTVCLAGGLFQNSGGYNPFGSEKIALNSLTLPDSLESIGSGAFRECKALTSVTIPSNVTFIGDSAFEDCKKLKSVTLPSGLKTIGSSAFYGCSKLSAIKIPNSVTSLGAKAFAFCGLTKATVGKGVPALEEMVFCGCKSLTSVTLPTGLKAICTDAFYGCTALTAVTIPESVHTIESKAFGNCSSLTELAIPAGVTWLEPDAFTGCTALTTVTVAEENPAYCIDAQYVLYNKDKTEVIQCLTDIAGKYTIPSTVTKISRNCFSGKTRLTGVVIPDSVKKYGDAIFSDCTGLKNVTLPENLKTIPESMFSGCTGLEKISIPAGVQEIELNAFRSCTGLSELIFPEGLRTIGEAAFYDCTGLKNLTLPKSLKQVEKSAFEGCTALENVYIEDLAAWCGIEFGGIKENSLGSWEYYEYVLENYGNPLQYAKHLYVAGKLTENLEIPAEITDVSAGAFARFAGLKSLSVPNRTTRVGICSFRECPCLERVEINGVIGEFAFAGSNALKDLKFGPNVEDISYGSFMSCKGLTELTVPATVKRFCQDSFKYCTGLTRIVTGDGSKSFRETSFYGCSALTSVIMGDGAKYLGLECFGNCYSLRTFRLGTGDVSANNYAFSRGKILEIYGEKGTGAESFANTNNNYTFVQILKSPTVTVTNDAATGKPKLTWKKVTNASGYKVYRAASKDGTYKPVKTTTALTYTNTAAEAGKAYYYKVVALAKDAFKYSRDSEVVSRTCDLARPVVTVSNDGATGKPKLTWKKIPGAAKYEVWRAASKTGTYTRLSTTTKLSYIHSGAATGKTYYYKVNAIHSKSAANSAFSLAKSRICKLPRPVVKASNAVSTGKPRLTWKKVDGAKEYKIYRATSKTGSYSLVKTTTKLSYTDTAVTAGKTRYYKVRAVFSNSAANSLQSPAQSVVCKLARPVVTISLSSGKPKLTWKKIPDAVKYQVYRSESKSSGYKLMKTTTSLSYTNTGAEKGKTYYYKVKAVHTKSAANSAYSLVKSIKATK